MSGGSELRRLARSVGLMAEWENAHGKPQQVSPEVLRTVLGALGYPADSEKAARDSLTRLREAQRSAPPPLLTAIPGEAVRLQGARAGRYRLTAMGGETVEGEMAAAAGGARITAPTLPGYYTLENGERTLTLAVAPPHGHRISDACGGDKAWGLAVQLYSLKRIGDGGVGDYRALQDFAQGAAAQGADAVAISPVHAQFTADPSRFSPYAPSSRLWLDVRYAEGETLVPHAPAFAPGLAEEWSRLEALDLVEWPDVARARILRARQLYAAQLQAPQEALRDALEAFRALGGTSLENHARFEALHAAQLAEDPSRWNWRDWPAALRDPDSAEVARFAEAQAEEVGFHIFLQFLADRGLASAQATMRDKGARIGLIADLAIGVDGGGSDAWARQTEFLSGVEIGAPPDIFNTRGQGWGITTYSPHGLVANGFAAFREMLGAAFRNAGGVRLDHVLGLRRLWLVPSGASPADGCYLRYPMDDLLRLVALESHLHQAIAIGEDLGTVPEGFRPRLQETGVAGMRVMWFEQTSRGFKAPQRWSREAVSMTSTHDLPTVAGWWSGADLVWRNKLGGGPKDQAQTRVAERGKLWAAFRQAGVAKGAPPPLADAAQVADAAAAFIGRAQCDLALLPLEDAVAAVEQPNLPGTVDEHPNWRRRLDPPVERLFADPAIEQRLRGLARARRAP
ncbi:4-alpha-glucanotransferase [Teichococcus vastitatis]|uniref:4-alpha-glucanotransferase n=1 Tax=Teichococcus vastitatis TaxID=2307076 RepID=A0ABS9W454_9PROT|nr:4-alpha-glucanotransferase [Pseudoroseomonas vastitatis]MCI0754064.1 4-alpha-glucanotransferase [Pseudoroseomonas vastitatis]